MPEAPCGEGCPDSRRAASFASRASEAPRGGGLTSTDMASIGMNGMPSGACAGMRTFRGRASRPRPIGQTSGPAAILRQRRGKCSAIAAPAEVCWSSSVGRLLRCWRSAGGRSGAHVWACGRRARAGARERARARAGRARGRARARVNLSGRLGARGRARGWRPCSRACGAQAGGRVSHARARARVARAGGGAARAPSGPARDAPGWDA